MGRVSAWLLAIAVLPVAVVAMGARAQENLGFQGNANLQRYQRQLDQIQRNQSFLVNTAVPVDQRLLIDYGGYVGFSYLSVDDTNNDNHVLRQTDAIGYLRLNLDDVHEFYVRGRLTYQDFNDGDNFDTTEGDELEKRIDRLYYRFDLRRAMAAYTGKHVDYDVALLGGRQLTDWANGLVLVQTLDGVTINLEYKSVDLQLLAATTPADMIDIDPNRPEFDHNTHRGFYGAMLSAQAGNHRPFLYFLSQQDNNHDYTTTIIGNQNGAPAPIVTHFNYNSWYLGAGSSGTFNEHLAYGLEAVYEGGSSLSNSFETAGASLFPVPQQHDRIQAFAADLRIDYLLNDDHRTRLSVEGTAATGDDDRRVTNSTFGGNKPGTNDTAFNAFGQINNGLAFAPTISNLGILRVGASTFPAPNATLFRQMQVGSDLFAYWKLSVDAPIDEPALNERYIGFEPDLFVNWQLTSDLSAAVRYGVFFPGDALLDHQARQFLYGGLTLAF